MPLPPDVGETDFAAALEVRRRVVGDGGVGVMPQFRKTEITDSELDAMIEYLVR